MAEKFSVKPADVMRLSILPECCERIWAMALSIEDGLDTSA